MPEEPYRACTHCGVFLPESQMIPRRRKGGNRAWFWICPTCKAKAQANYEARRKNDAR